MNRTKRYAENPQRLPDILNPGRRSSHRWTIALVAAFVAVGATGCTVQAASRGEDLTTPTPAPAAISTSAADRAAVQGLAEAFAAHDVGVAAQYIAPGAELWDGWTRHWERDAAWRAEVVMEQCAEVEPTSWAAEFSCPFTMHLMGSREAGSGPFADNALTIRVADGKVLSADTEIPFQTNGLSEHLDGVYTWLEANHPDQVAFLETDELALADDEWPRWLQLWNQYLAEYVAANEAG